MILITSCEKNEFSITNPKAIELHEWKYYEEFGDIKGVGPYKLRSAHQSSPGVEMTVKANGSYAVNKKTYHSIKFDYLARVFVAKDGNERVVVYRYKK